jgi:hypothetical protein
MRKLFPVLFSAAFLLIFAAAVRAGGNESLDPLTSRAASTNAEEAAAAVKSLREEGPAGLDALFQQYADEIQQHTGGAGDAERWRRVNAALDSVAQQRNAYTSHLYWYTDLEQAKKAAAAGNRPILSLRLLGNLTDEFSCANSRFFRTVLYANPSVANYLRQNYILHWSSERAAPRIVIDYGDGRKLERTITGNSIHYVLDANGTPVDALPGLYGPGAFLRELVRSAAFVKSLNGKPDNAQWAAVAAYHQQRLNETKTSWAADLTAAGVNPRDIKLDPVKNPSAVDAAPRAMGKAMVEFNLLPSITADTRRLDSLTDLQAWTRIANRHLGDAALHDNSIRLMRRELAAADAAVFDATVRKFQNSIALDSVRNEYLLRSTLHAWFINDRGFAEFEGLNARVYTQLFLTPKDDPWVGLMTADVYTGLENGGVIRP